MFRRIVLTFFIVFIFCFLACRPSSADDTYNQAQYSEFMQAGKEALYEGDYRLAGKYFSQAQRVYPEGIAAVEYLNFVKRMDDENVDYLAEDVSLPVESTEAANEIVENENEVAPQPSFIPPQIGPSPKNVRFPSKSIPVQAQIIDLDDVLWATQPRTLIQVELGRNIILRGNNIERYLLLSPGFIEIRRINNDEVNLIGAKRGSTLMHLWDARGRWTFNDEVILPIEQTSVTPSELERTGQSSVRPFRFSYASDWTSYNTGRSLNKTDRVSLSYIQTLKLEGETPYGNTDGWVVFNKFAESTEATGYGIGLTNGHIGNWKNFTIRGYDTAKTFSPLTMPGQYLRGVLYEQRAFDGNLDFAYVRGRDRATYGFLAPGVLEQRESFVEGAKVTFFGKTENNYSFNYARGWGIGRPEFLDEQVYSVQGVNRFGPTRLESEYAVDDSDFAKTLKFSNRERSDFDWSIALRDIEEDFTTITNLPPNQGEVGSTLSADWEFNEATLSSVVDVYRDRVLPNADNPRAVNLDFSTYFDVPLTETDRINSSLLYVDTPGELAPRRSIRLNSNYTKRLEWWENHPLTTLLGGTLQRNRFEFSPVADYDRQSILTGLRYVVMKDLDYFLNYEWSWVNQKSNNEDFTPSVLNTGLNYTYEFTKKLRGDANINYRDEQQADGLNSFLAGEDSVSVGLGLNYRPYNDVELFADSRVRNVWRESDDSTAFHEVDIHWGVRSAWDTPIFWNPKGVIYGTVYKDANSNGVRDFGETGVANVKVKVGQHETTTNENGHYAIEIKAKTAWASVDINSLPKGVILSEQSQKEVVIEHRGWKAVDFAVSTHSGIFGIIYEDINNNGKPDSDDKLIQRVRITLDNQESTLSEFDGSYFFRNISPGNHTIKFDVNSFPKNYLPKVKIVNEVNVEEGVTYTLHVPIEKK